MSNNCVDTIKEKGVRRLSEVTEEGRFMIKYYSLEELKMLQEFFQVRSNKYDMRLLYKRNLQDILLKGSVEKIFKA